MANIFEIVRETLFRNPTISQWQVPTTRGCHASLLFYIVHVSTCPLLKILLYLSLRHADPTICEMATSPSTILPFNYLIILDVEAHCDDPNDPHRLEIVEFPWLVYDLATASVLDHKQIYITPRWNANPNPSPDAIQSLNVDVAFAPSLEEALIQFDAYVYQSFIAPQKSFCLLTDGHWDLAHCLYVEAARKAVHLSPHFRAYFNLRSEFCKCYPGAPMPHDRSAMFAYLDISPSTRSTGIDECLGLAELVTRIVHGGHTFAQPEIISDMEWASFPARFPTVGMPVATASPVGAVIRLRGLPWESSERDVEKFLEGIPIAPGGIHFVQNAQGRATGEAFVQLEDPDSVSAALQRDKLSVGRRYIEVFRSSPMDMANHLGRADARRQLHAGAAITNRAKGPSTGGNGNNSGVSRGRPGSRGKDSNNSGRCVVKVSGLGTEANADDVGLLLEGVQIIGEGVVMVHAADGGLEAFVEVASEAHVKKALGRTNTHLPVGSSTGPDSVTYVRVEVRRVSVAALRAAVATEAANVQRELASSPPLQGVSSESQATSTVDTIADLVKDVHLGEQICSPAEPGDDSEKVSRGNNYEGVTGVSDGTTSDTSGVDTSSMFAGANLTGSFVVRMRGLPFSSGNEDIVAFFDGFQIAPDGIWRGKDRHGRPSGEACVTFVSENEARRAVSTLDKAHMGNRYIELKI